VGTGHTWGLGKELGLKTLAKVSEYHLLYRIGCFLGEFSVAVEK